MSGNNDRPRVLRAIKKCLSNAFAHLEDAMDALDEIGRGSFGAGMTPLIGGYAMKDPKSFYRTALISIDSMEKALRPLAIRVRDGRVNESHFTDERALVILMDIIETDYDYMIIRLSKELGRDSTWYKLREIRTKIKEVLEMVAEE